MRSIVGAAFRGNNDPDEHDDGDSVRGYGATSGGGAGDRRVERNNSMSSAPADNDLDRQARAAATQVKVEIDPKTGRPKGPLPGVGRGPTPPCCVISTIHALNEEEYSAVSSPVEKLRKGEMAIRGMLMIVFLFWPMVTSGVGLFTDDVYNIGSSACRCVLATHYIGLFEASIVIAITIPVPLLFMHDPDAGPWGPEGSARNRFNVLFHHPHWALLVGAVAQAVATFVFILAFLPLMVIVCYYIFYGIFFCFFFMGTCRIDCEQEPIMDTGHWGGDFFVGFYHATFSSDVLPFWPESEPWAVVSEDETVPGVIYFTKFVWFAALVNLAIAYLADVALWVYVLRKKQQFAKSRIARGLSLKS